MAVTTETIVDKVDVTLAMPHMHDGKQYKTGDKLSVTAQQKQWLQKRGVIIDKKPKTGEQ
jgi:hypothetical protein